MTGFQLAAIIVAVVLAGLAVVLSGVLKQPARREPVPAEPVKSTPAYQSVTEGLAKLIRDRDALSDTIKDCNAILNSEPGPTAKSGGGDDES